MSFKGNILTIGTGIGLMLFWDLRASKFLESTMNSNRAVTLKASRGWVVSGAAVLVVVVVELSLAIVVILVILVILVIIVIIVIVVFW